MATSRERALLNQQEVLARFGEFALTSDDLDEILSEACRLVGEALGTDLAKVMELQEDGETLRVRAGIGWKPGIVGTMEVRASPDSSEGYALRTGEPLISPDRRRETRFRYVPFIEEAGVEALVNVIIIGAKGRPPYGLLQVDSRHPRDFNEDDSRFLQSYANLIAAAVNRLRIIDALRANEARLRESHERQEAALETGLIGFFEWDVERDVVTGDARLAGFYGIDRAALARGVGHADLVGLIEPSDRAAVQESVTRATASGGDYVKTFRVGWDDPVRWLLVHGHCLARADGRGTRYAGTAIDVTATKAAESALRRANEELEARVAERTRALSDANAKLLAEAEERERIEEELRQSQKMEAVGQLTGGLAHDFNNLLAGIIGSLELMRVRIGQGQVDGLDRYIDIGLEAAARAAALTHRLLAFSRRQTLDPRPTDVARLVVGMEELIRRTAGPATTIEVVRAPDLPTVLVDPNQLENALLNLCLNARDAMPEGGRITVRLAGEALDAGAARALDLEPGHHLVLSVTDTGAGMPPDVLARAFDPFFTTKPLGQGTGLGLSMIYGFARQSGGQARIVSAPGAGTTVSLYLPRHDAEAARLAAEAVPARGGAAHRATVLVVDDEPAIRMLVTDVLADLGLDALEAADGASALAIVRGDRGIDLLVSDVGLPGGMNGRQLADAARTLRPELKVLFITGYAETAAADRAALAPGMSVMTKPFGLGALATRIREMLDAG